MNLKQILTTAAVFSLAAVAFAAGNNYRHQRCKA